MAMVQTIGNLRTAPVWAKDYGGREHVVPFGIKLDPAQFTNAAGAPVTLTAGAAQGATSITISPLNYASTVQAVTVLDAQGNTIVPAGTVLDFGDAKFARTTADALYGATTIAVAALVTALVTGDTATFSKYGGIFVPSGTLVGRTFAQQASNTPFGPADTTTPDDEIYLVYFDVPNLLNNNDAEAYRPASAVALNYLPFTPSTNDLVQLRKIYQCFVATD